MLFPIFAMCSGIRRFAFRAPVAGAAVWTTAVAGGCGLASEPPEVAVPVHASASSLDSFTTDLGYEVEIDTLRVAAEGVYFTVGGDEHEAADERSAARAGGDGGDRDPAYHPGHAVGGEVMGELREPFVLDAGAGGELGEAAMIAEDYDGADLVFRNGGPEVAGIEESGPLDGYGAEIEGRAEREGESWTFDARVDLSEAEVAGIPVDVTVSEEEPSPIELELAPQREGATLLDGVALAGAEEGADGGVEIRPGSGYHDRLAGNLSRHELYFVASSEE